jgi:RNA polymerase sigma factor (TIGR02999 family)
MVELAEALNEDVPADTAHVSALLNAAERGELSGQQVDALFSALYRELHRLARRELYRGGGALTLGATTLLHETYIDLCARGLSFRERDRFFAYAARAMRGLIVDRVRARRAIKRGGEFHLTSFDATDAQEIAAETTLEPLSDALDALARQDPALAELVELKFFCGFDLTEIARMRGVTERTAQRHWDKARVFLKHALAAD